MLEYKGIIKYAIKQSAKHINKKKAHPNIKSRPTTSEEAAQAHSETNQRKAVVRWLHLGAAAPRVRPHLPLPTGPRFL
jgi:hypothetical protein